MRALMFSIGLALCACQPRGPKAELPAVPGAPFHLQIVEGDEPNDYGVSLTWNSEVKPATWFVHRRESGNEPVEVAKLAGEQVAFTDGEVEAGKLYEYVLGYTEQGDFRIRGRAEVKIPTDYIATGRLVPSDIPVANRIFFRGTVEASAIGSELKFVANEIVSEDAILEFTSYFRGASVERLTIAAPRARGHLKIVANGLPGRAGHRKRFSFPEEIQPTNGADSALVYVETQSDRGFSVDVQRTPGKGGKWFEEPRTPGASDGQLRSFCVRQNKEEFGHCQEFPFLLKQ
jgi:hypothetical protein